MGHCLSQTQTMPDTIGLPATCVKLDSMHIGSSNCVSLPTIKKSNSLRRSTADDNMVNVYEVILAQQLIAFHATCAKCNSPRRQGLLEQEANLRPEGNSDITVSHASEPCPIGVQRSCDLCHIPLRSRRKDVGQRCQRIGPRRKCHAHSRATGQQQCSIFSNYVGSDPLRIRASDSTMSFSNSTK